MIAVIDASVALKWFVTEPDTPAAENVLRLVQRTVAPDLVVAEVSNAAWRRARLGHITKQHAVAIATGIAARFDELFGLGDLAPSATAIAFELDRPVYDCFYVALAEKLDGRLVTADERLIRQLGRTRWRKRIGALAEFA